jgi:hypothetical protein
VRVSALTNPITILVRGLEFGLAVCVGWEKHLNECYLLFRECGLGCCLGVRSILERGIKIWFGFGLCWLRETFE